VTGIFGDYAITAPMEMFLARSIRDASRSSGSVWAG